MGEETVLSAVLDLEKAVPKGTSLAVYLATDKSCTQSSNYKLIQHEEVDGTQVLLDKVQINADGDSWKYTHITLYTKNDFGTSKFCSTIPFKSKEAEKKTE